MLREETSGRPRPTDPVRPALSIVVPVYNLAEAIVDNVRTIRERVAAKLPEPFEVIVVSDGSVDESEERILEGGAELARVIHYDRNLGKGYAVKIGALTARGSHVAFVDADLDLDPSALPDYLELARHERLDFVIGSKRHPESTVHYPLPRRAGSWLYQQLVRLLFRLDVRDTQVGLKLFRREVAEEVLPLLLVKQFAFDLEFLAVGRALGFDRIVERPVSLRYRFTGSGVHPSAVLLALVDTAAIFYRLRILRYYQRKRELLPDYARAREFHPVVSLVVPDPDQAQRLEYEQLEVLPDGSPRGEAVARASGEIVGFVQPGGVPAGNWLESTVPFLARPDVAAVVTASMTPARGSLRERAAAAVAETWLGGGSHHFRFTPGNLRFVEQFPAENILARKADLAELDEEALHPHRLCAALVARGRKVLYTPETVVVAARPPLFRPHLARVRDAGVVRGREIRHRGLAGVTAPSLPPLALLAAALLGWPLLLLGGPLRLVWVGVMIAYAGVVLSSAVLAGLRFRSLRVAALVLAGVPAVHVVYAVGVLRGIVR